jgi:hypothetical protein
MNEPDYLIPGVQEFVEGEARAFRVAVSRYPSGASLASPSVAVYNAATGANVTSDYTSTTIGATYVQWDAVTFDDAGDFRVHLSVNVNGNRRTDVQRCKVTSAGDA